jgi:hypothetical protein
MMTLSETQREHLWDEVRAEFPGDELMQEIHFVQYKLQLQMEGMSDEEQIRYINSFGER